MQELLALTVGLPERVLAPDEVLIADGEPAAQMYVLLEGHVVLRRNGDDLVTFDQPGVCIGEKAVLLGRAHQSAAIAVQPSRVRVIADAPRAIREQPDLLLAVATLLAGRLDMVEGFLSDLRHQYSDHEGGLGMIGEVLGELAHHHGSTVSPGSERDPDPLY